MPLVLNRCPKCKQEDHLETTEVWRAEDAPLEEAGDSLMECLCMDCIGALHEAAVHVPALMED